MSDTNYEPYATKEDVQALRGDLLERIGQGENRLTERIANVEGQLSIIVRLNYFIAASLLAMAIKVIFFSGPSTP